MRLRPIRYALLWAVAAVAFAGCGDDPLDPDVTGLVNVVVGDNPTGAAGFMGTANGSYRAQLISTGDEVAPVGSLNGITVTLQSSTATSVHGAQSVPAGKYDRVRLTLSGVTFDVTDAGTTFTNTGSAVAGGTTDLELEISVSEFTVSEGGTTAIVTIDLNVEDWLTNAMLTAGVIAEGDVTGLTAVATSG